MTTTTELRDYLTPNCPVVRRCRLTFHDGLDRRRQPKDQTLLACYYEQHGLKPPDGAPNQAPYDRRGFNTLLVPKCYIKQKGNSWNGDTRLISRSRRVCFRLHGLPEGWDADKDWYVASYFLESKRGELPQQPFGENALLMPWTVDVAIDLYDEYERLDVDIEWEDDPVPAQE